jgi:hypothetical protein
LDYEQVITKMPNFAGLFLLVYIYVLFYVLRVKRDIQMLV